MPHLDGTENAFRTLSYFDGVHFAARATTPILFSTGLMNQMPAVHGLRDLQPVGL